MREGGRAGEPEYARRHVDRNIAGIFIDWPSKQLSRMTVFFLMKGKTCIYCSLCQRPVVSVRS